MSLVVCSISWSFLVRCFFFFKQKAAYEMRISDWSSDVCSSDLVGDRDAGTRVRQVLVAEVRLQLAVRGHDLLADRALRVRGQRLAIGFRYRVGELRERPVERALRRLLDDLRGDLRRHALHQHLDRKSTRLNSSH